jgi:hypothetical protein
MATAFSVRIDIGGKLLPSLAGAVSGAKAQVKGLEASLIGIGARTANTFAAVNKHLAASQKRMANVQRAGRNMTFGVTMPTAFVGANWIKQAAAFEGALNTAEALGDLPSAERGGLEKIARDLAKRYDAGGARGVVSVTTELMKAGLSFEQAKGSLEQVLAASALAGDMTPADVGASLSKSLAQFQMPVSTLDQVTKSSQLVTDRMVYAAVSTVASMKDVSESFKYAGGVMSATGNSLDQTTGIVMSFAKAGVLGSEAGVALRSALVRLVKMPKGGLAALSRIGMNLGDYTSARPVTGNGIVGGLQAGGIDASKIERQIDSIIKANAGRGPATLGAAITKAVQTHLGDSSAVGADTIAENVNAAITAAGSKIDVVKFFTDLKAKFDSGAATMGDISRILEARHISRYMALLKDDLPALIAKIGSEAEGYSQERYKTKQKGLPADLTRLAASFDQFHNSLVKAVAPELSSTLERAANAIERIGKTSPAILKLGVGLVTAAAAAGPLAFVLGGIGRLAAGALGGVVASAALMTAGVTKALTGIGAAAVLATTRIRAFAAGAMVLGAVGGRGAVFAAMGAGLASFGRAVLLFPLTALRAISVAMWALVANPVGIAIAAVVAALAALGVWVSNNWSGVLQFFESFGKVFTASLGPDAAGALSTITTAVGTIYKTISRLLGPLDATGEKWATWGGTLGGIVAGAVNTVANAITKVIGLFSAAIERAVSFGNALSNIGHGIFGGSAGPAKAPFVSNSISGARALGGPVSYGKSYLVGERGPEFFTPGASGQITSNDRLRRLTADGAATVAGSSSSTSSTRGPVTIMNHWEINGADDPRAVASQIDSRFGELLRQMERQQSGLLSD